jgi:hypothetical protein
VRPAGRAAVAAGHAAELKSDPGPLALDTLLAEIGKLSAARALGLDEAVFGASDRIVAAWRARAARMYPSDFTDCPDPVRYMLLAALCWTPQAELVDGLAETAVKASASSGAQDMTSRITSGSSTRGSMAVVRARRSTSEGGSSRAFRPVRWIFPSSPMLTSVLTASRPPTSR